MRIVVLGTGAFAVPTLHALAEHHEVVLVVTQPDRPAGRRGSLRRPPVKITAEKLNLPIAQPERINRPATVDQLRAAAPETIVAAAYGQLLRPAVFDLPPLGTINIHASLLPAYRGAAPVNWAIIRGERTTGVTTFVIDEGMDTGALLLQRPLEIDPDETATELEARLAQLGARMILETLEGLQRGDLRTIPQPESGVSYAPLLERESGRIDWSRPSKEIHDLVRGTALWPGAWTMLSDERIKVLRTKRTHVQRGSVLSGSIACSESGRLLVAGGDDLIELLEVQREGRRRVTGPEFLSGVRSARRFT